MKISAVIPVYGCRAALPELHRRLSLALSELADSYEIILVNDNCPQNSWEVIEEICRKDDHVKGIELSRNFGQMKAILAGLDYSTGDWVVVMDCDLEFRSKRYNELVAQALAMPAAEADGGALVSFESDNPRYSYAEIDDEGRVLRTAEKEPISNHALCGAYFFGSGKDFKRIAHQLLVDGTHGKAEFYVSLLYNYLLTEGKVVRLAPMEEYYSYGTPEELMYYSNEHK